MIHDNEEKVVEQMHDEFTVVGTIIGTHSLKGEVKVYSVTDFKEDRYQVGNTLHIAYREEMVPVKIKSYREHKGNALLSFEGYPTINDVEKFVKSKIYVHNSQLQDLEDDEFYYFELMGCTVLTNDEKELGIIKDIVNYGASDIIIVESQDQKEIMIPFVNDFIEEVDLETRTVVINPIEGLLGESRED
jgi:16S rRNA processing protein RimM